MRESGKMVESAFAIVVLPEEVRPESARRNRGWVNSGVDEVDGLASCIVGRDNGDLCNARNEGPCCSLALWRQRKPPSPTVQSPRHGNEEIVLDSVN